MRVMWSLMGAALMWTALASGALAENGLERFEREIKPQIELEKFTYSNAAPLGTSGFVLNDVVAVMPPSGATGDKSSTLKIDKVTVEEIDFDRLKKGDDNDMPRFAKVKLQGMMGDDEVFAALAPYGVPKVAIDVELDYRLDTASKVFTLNKLEINLRGQARLSLALVMDGISDKSSEMEDTKDDGRLRTASLTLDDSGLIAKVLPAAAKEQGNTPEGLVALSLVSISAFTEGQGPETLNILDAVASFVADWKAPKGPLAVNLKPAKTAALSDIDKVMVPNALVDVFGLSVSYPGTRAGAAKAGPAAK
ncbi:MAG: hypothetical protein ACHQK9_19720 [Reyranellales bacterium]